jgi:hypothetical protein
MQGLFFKTINVLIKVHVLVQFLLVLINMDGENNIKYIEKFRITYTLEEKCLVGHDTVQYGFQMFRRNVRAACNTFLRTAGKFPPDYEVLHPII